MSVYQLKPEAFREVRKKLIVRFGVITITIIIFLVLKDYWNYQNGRDSSLVGTLLTILLFLGVMVFTVFLNLKRQKTIWKSFRLFIGEEYIIRSQQKLPPVQIKKNEIQEIIRAGNGSLIIKTADKRHFIVIPKEIDHYKELLMELGGFSQIKAL